MSFRDKVAAKVEQKSEWHPTCRACAALQEIAKHDPDIVGEIIEAMDEANAPVHYTAKEVTWEAIVQVLKEDYPVDFLPDGRTLSRHYRHGHRNV